ncbi:putative porin [Psychroserpens sp. XS_ASV72]
MKPKLKQTQIENDTLNTSSRRSSANIIKNEDAKIEQYLIISSSRDTTYVDTTLSIKKEYKFNYLRRDNFGLIPFSNIGQTYNALIKPLDKQSTLPIFGSRARHFNYMEIDDIDYYHVPTPLTELFYKTAFQQGQVLDAFFTVNTSPQFNFSIAYKGLRSLGNYQHILTSTGNFRVTANYHTKNRRYNIRAHVVTQDLLNEENGGITDEDVINFQSGDEDFIDRAVFDPQFQNAESILKGKRVYLDHEYLISKPEDSIQNKLAIGHILSFEDKYYQFDQTQADDFFGEAFVRKIVDRTTLENFYNRMYVMYNSNTIGNFQMNLDYSNYNYGYDNVTVLESQIIPNRIKDNTIAIGANYKNTFGEFLLSGEVLANISGLFEGSSVKAGLGYSFNDDIDAKATITLNSSAPNYNYLLYTSDYINYNWYNLESFDNVNTNNFKFELNSSKLANVTFDYYNIENYTYFKRLVETESVKPFQSSNPINYYKLNINKEITFGKFALDNTLMYQDVIEGEGDINIPQFITRNTFYYSNSFFKDALFLQTGIIFNYFTEYYMDGYDPLLAEFYVQDKTMVGDFPRLDFFLNAKIRQTRIFFKAEHFNSAFTGYNYFSAPNYPYRDFTIRFGLVWNFFL